MYLKVTVQHYYRSFKIDEFTKLAVSGYNLCFKMKDTMGDCRDICFYLLAVLFNSVILSKTPLSE